MHYLHLHSGINDNRLLPAARAIKALIKESFCGFRLALKNSYYNVMVFVQLLFKTHNVFSSPI